MSLNLNSVLHRYICKLEVSFCRVYESRRQLPMPMSLTEMESSRSDGRCERRAAAIDPEANQKILPRPVIDSCWPMAPDLFI